MNKINIKKCFDEAILPTRAHEDDAGYDLYASPYEGFEAGSVPIIGNGNQTFHTGIAMEIPKGYVGLVFARSGIGVKRGLKPRNCVGVIDSNYRGEIMVCLHNDTSATAYVEVGERIAQIVIVPYYKYELNLVDELSDTDRGENGWGSSGTK